MDFRKLKAALRATLLILSGAAAMLAWREGFYANAALALLVAVWLAVILTAMSSHDGAPVSAAPPPPDDKAMREQKRLIAYLNLSPAPLVTLDRQMRLWAVNRAARRLFGADDLIAQPPAELISAISATAPGQTASVTISGDRAAALATADLDAGGEGGRIAALIDIDAELKAAEATALRDLLQVLSHEIMNALTPISSLGRTAAELMTDARPDIAAVRDAVETIARRAEGLHRFSRAYRDLARLPPPDTSRVDVELFAADLQRMFETSWSARATLLVNLDAAPPTIVADADQLTAAIWALLQNAVEAAVDARVTVNLDLESLGKAVLIRVIDDGPGLQRTNADDIFQPFFTTRPDGSGIGLTLARQIARAHGGDLKLAAKGPATPERGAQFVLTIPSI